MYDKSYFILLENIKLLRIIPIFVQPILVLKMFQLFFYVAICYVSATSTFRKINVFVNLFFFTCFTFSWPELLFSLSLVTIVRALKLSGL